MKKYSKKIYGNIIVAKNKRKFIKHRFFINKSSFFSFKKRQFRVYDSIVYRRVKVLKRVRNLNFKLYSTLLLRYQNLRWLKDLNLIGGFIRYKKDVEFFESQGLKRKNLKRRLSDFAVSLQDKQKLKYFYLGLKEFSLRNIVRQVFHSKINHLDVFVSLLESRLGSVLYRLNLFSSLLKMKEIVKKGLILINGHRVFNVNYNLVIGDIISLDKFFLNKLKSKKFIFFKKRISLFFYPSRYLEISFSLFKFLYYKKPTIEDIAYPFNLNLVRILSFYNKKGLR